MLTKSGCSSWAHRPGPGLTQLRPGSIVAPAAAGRCPWDLHLLLQWPAAQPPPPLLFTSCSWAPKHHTKHRSLGLLPHFRSSPPCHKISSTPRNSTDHFNNRPPGLHLTAPGDGGAPARQGPTGTQSRPTSDQRVCPGRSMGTAPADRPRSAPAPAPART